MKSVDSSRLLFAIPKKGRLYEQILELLSGIKLFFNQQELTFNLHDETDSILHNAPTFL